MSDTASIVEVQPLVLRVLAGRARGASAPLERGQTATVGHDLDSDIVLRGAGAEGVRLRLKARADAADLELIEGSVVLLGHALTAPAQALLPFYLPLMIGENAVAIGDPDSSRWSEAERILVAALPSDDDVEADTAPSGQPWQYLLNDANAVVSRSMKFVPVLMIALITVAALFAVNAAAPAWPKMQPRPAKVQEVLQEEGFTDLVVTRTSEGELRIEGMVPSDADQARLQRLMTARDWQPRLQVQSHEGMARQVQDFYQTNGVEAWARSVGPGVVRLDVSDGTPEEAGRLQRLAMTEVKGVRRIEISMLPQADDGGRFEDIQEGGGKRVVAVIGGPRGHIATADGARYFPGAVLPTGHRIIGIEETKVLVERNGTRSELIF